MSTKKPVFKKRAYKKKVVLKATSLTAGGSSTILPNKTFTSPLKTTVITIAPDGIITITKTEETVSEQVMTKAE